MLQKTDVIAYAFRSILSQKETAADPHPAALRAAMDVFIVTAEALSRIFSYARITVDALERYKQDVPQVGSVKWPAPRKRKDRKGSEAQLVESLEKQLADTARLGDIGFLRSQGDNAPATVYGQAAISMWGAIEAGIEDMLIAVVQHDPEVARRDEIQKVQLSLAEYNAMSEMERAEYLVQRVEEKHKSKTAKGAERFECTLAAFGLGDALDDALKHEMFEFAAVRNCLVHRGGVVDREFMKAAPLTKRNVGSKIEVTLAELRRFHTAGTQYGASVAGRIDKRYGLRFAKMQPIAERLLSDLKTQRADAGLAT